jgi:tRNA1Val (adenine37-N6)-methyltransferase
LSFYHNVDKNERLKDVTYDTLYDGRLRVHQPKQGFRLSCDALLITQFATGGRRSKACVDLGAGCGVIGLGLLLCGHAEAVTGVEVQPGLAELARVNATLNGCEARYDMVEGDIRFSHAGLKSGAFDLVISNPPFWPKGTGRPPADRERLIASQEVLGTIQDWTDVSARLIHQKRGRVLMVFPARRLDDLLFALKASKLSCTRLRLVHPIETRPAELLMVEARYGKTGRMEVQPPLILKKANGEDTEAAREIFSGAFSENLMKLPSNG